MPDCQFLVYEYPDDYLNNADVTPLHAAVFKNQLPQVTYHVEYLTRQNKSLDTQTEDGDTSLLLACKLPLIDDNIPKLLVKAGADVNISDDNECTPLHAACVMRKVDVAELLLQAGATVNSVGSSDCVTPLHCAAWVNNFKLVELLLDAGADPNIVDDYGEHPLLYSNYEPEEYDETTVEKLLSVTTDFNTNCQTVLVKTIEAGNERLLSLLIKYGADVNCSEDIILHAISYEQIEMVKMLWSAANVEKFNEEFTSFYHNLVNWSWDETTPEKVECFYEVMNTSGVRLHPGIRYLENLLVLLITEYSDVIWTPELFKSKRDSFYKITKQLLKSGAVFLEDDLKNFIYLCREFHDYNYINREIELINFSVDNNADVSPHVIYFSVLNYPQFTLYLLSYCVLCDPIDIFKYFSKIRRIIDISLLNLIKNVLRLCSPSEELRFQCFLNIQSLSDSREWPDRGLFALERQDVPVDECIRDSEIDYELCEDVLDLLLLNRVPTLLELSRDKVRQHLRFSCIEGTTAYLQNLNKLDVLKIVENIIRCKVTVNL